MFARVASYSGDADGLVQGFEAVCSYVEETEGFVNAYCCLNRSRAKGLIVTLWESEDALEASALEARQLRSWVSEPAGATVDSVMDYEVAMRAQKAGARAG
jgi:heme-degrading monooxygenase HmoA